MITFYFIVENAELGKFVEPIRIITFDKLRGRSLGHPLNILFWNDQQKHVSNSIDKMEHTLLMGDYGTGKIIFQNIVGSPRSMEIPYYFFFQF